MPLFPFFFLLPSQQGVRVLPESSAARCPAAGCSSRQPPQLHFSMVFLGDVMLPKAPLQQV